MIRWIAIKVFFSSLLTANDTILLNKGGDSLFSNQYIAIVEMVTLSTDVNIVY